MRTPASLVHSSSSTTAAAPNPAASSSSSSAPAAMISIDPNMVVILASLLCALVCLAGLALVARCTCRHARRSSPFAGNSITMTLPLPPRGLKKKAIDALPVTAVKEGHQLEEQCAICLADLATGEELRVLPRCGHSFHVACVDAWLRTCATCPTCRAAIIDSSMSSSSCSLPAPPLPAPGRCRRCGAACDGEGVAASASADTDGSSFLP
ncbi:probable E3 ubiquitin-protein ligase ATL44 [Triticum aestivum]|uniref:RING-type domain-containing protein n=1 Tax=Triticum aestivum TaxID=4565 RepID=A0A3B6QLU4_WHEAT|nr:probable E3 ubiquitin-protein ligase ATL44 [Triticum aestivum]